MSNSFLTLILVGLLAPVAAHAAETYISQSSGNDASDGKSPATAWKTLAKASEATYASGDKILLKCGDTWGNDTLRPKGLGTADHPIVIASYGTGNKPILDGLDDQQDRMGIHLNRTKGLTFTDCLVKPLGKACSTENLALKATASASSAASGHEAGKAMDGNGNTSWQADKAAEQWMQLDFGSPKTINEFRLREEASSSIARYVIECWDDQAAKWIGCFNGMAIGPDFIAPIVSRTTTKARLLVKRTASGNPGIAEFEAYNDTTRIVVKGTKQAASKDAHVVIDAFDIQPGPSTP